MAHPRVGSFRARRAALTQLANRELLFQVKSLVGRERKLEVDVLFHLIEVESRRLHLDLGFPSMFQYCVDGLGYPRATAARRMKVARCLRDSSQATVLLEAGDVSLGVLYLVARVLTPSNEDDVLACIRAKTESEAESILAEFGGPAPKIRERVVRIASTERPPLPSTLTLYDQQDGAKAARPTSASGTIVLGEAARTGGAAAAAGTATAGGAAASGGTAAAVAGTATAGEAAASGGTAAAGCADTAGSVPHLSETPESALGSTQEPSNGSPLGSSAPKTTSSSPPQTPEQGSARHLPASPATRPREEYRLVAVIDDQTRRKLERALALRSRGQAKPASIAETLGAALDRYLSENCPIERDKRRRARKEQQEAKRSGATHSSGTETDSNAAPPDTRHSAASSRPYIPIAVRDAVVARDEGRCTFVGPEGRRCTATDDLDLDHRLPIALGGSSSIDNLRVLCRRHNQREADRLLGQAFMDQRRTEGRTQSQSETRPEPQLVDR